MKKQVQFVSVQEQALESVAGGLFDSLNGSLNGNTVNFLSNIGVSIKTGDIGSNSNNLLNEVDGGW